MPLYLEHLYFASYTVAATVYMIPGTKGSGNLPLVQQSMKGWRRLCPPRARMPVPYETVCLLAMKAFNTGNAQICLFLLLSFLLYLRPGEALKIQVQDIVSPVKQAGRAYQHYAILLHPAEEGIPSKTQQWDEMLSLDLKRFKFLGPLLISWLNIRSRPKSEPAFSVSLQDVTDFCHDHWSSLGLFPLGKFHLHRLRHGGASHEAANRLRSLVGIQGRGRWQSLKSVRNYEKGSRLAQLFGSLDVQTQKQCIQAKKDVQKLSSERP